MKIIPGKEEFLRLTEQGNLIPIYQEILGDCDTPVSAYYKIAGDATHSFLLESVEGEEKVAQFSFLARDPEMVIRSQQGVLTVSTMKRGRVRHQTIPITDSPLTHIRHLIKQYKFVTIPGLPRFCGGLVGYLGYDMVRYFERLPDRPADDLALPDMLLVMAKNLVIFDHLNHRMRIVHCVEVDPQASDAVKLAAYQAGQRQIQALVKDLQRPLPPQKKGRRTPAARVKVRSNMDEAGFTAMIKAAQERIRAGDIIQVVLSQRFETPLPTEPFNIYRMLRALNPSPYMYYLNFADLQIIGSSPELLVRCEDGVVDTRPIAGTRPRGKDEAEDEALKEDLLRDPKERAEHIMLVDLGRNDLGRVCRRGTVHLSEFMQVERYSHVMHIVSNVRGRLRRGQDAIDVLAAAFPAGTVSGAPKIRAMEIIDELETVGRGPYAGCIGYFSFSGNLDSCITIRTIVVAKGRAYLQAGAGIVADSDPATEYQETVNKARAQVQAIESAQQIFENP